MAPHYDFPGRNAMQYSLTHKQTYPDPKQIIFYNGQEFGRQTINTSS